MSRALAGVKVAVRTRITKHEEHRRSQGYSVTGLARELDRSHTYVSRVESGEISASPWYRSRVSELLEVSEQDLFDGDGVVR